MNIGNTIKKVIRTFASPIRQLNRSNPQGIRILVYHSVGILPDKRLKLDNVLPHNFEKQMAYLAQEGYTVISLNQISNLLNSGNENIPSKAVALTFDDGYRNVYLHAYPILKQYGFVATVFPVYNYIGTAKLFEWDKKLDGVGHSAKKEFSSLSWTELREMHANGISIGSHTLNHSELNNLTMKRLKQEISDSKQRLEEKLNVPIDFFCYPRGKFNQKVKEITRASGYLGACSLIIGLNSSKDDLYILKRTPVISLDSLQDFKRKLAGSDDWLQFRYRRLAMKSN